MNISLHSGQDYGAIVEGLVEEVKEKILRKRGQGSSVDRNIEHENNEPFKMIISWFERREIWKVWH